MKKIVECVPNFSDGRRSEVYNGIADAIRTVTGLHILGVSPDADHNRTVITFAGTPEAVEEGAFRAIRKAAELIDLDEHEGEHPRIGATDVCPFVPVQGVSMAECVAMAQRLGKRVGKELGIAVYLYGEAATRPERQLLGKIRKGQYEKWREEVATNPDRAPDFGPAEPKSWGATVIGARQFLIAYNLYLSTNDVAIAQKIARAVRFSSGGLRFVQAMGFLVDGQAQVSMNLTNFEKTTIPRIQEMVKREAVQYGVQVTQAELVGLVPQKALLDSAKYYLQLDSLEDEQILELKLAEEERRAREEREPAGIQPPYEFINATAGKTATPGGGSVAALVGALGAALAQMMAGLTAGRKKYADVSDQAEAIVGQAEVVREQLTNAISQDIAAFDGFMAVIRDKSLTGTARTEAMQKATIRTGEVPLQVMRDCLTVAELSKQIVSIGNTNAITDGASGVLFARAAAEAAGLNVRINALGLQDEALAQAWRTEVDALNNQILELVEVVLDLTVTRGGL